MKNVKLSRAIIPAALAGTLLLAGCSASGNPTKDAAGKSCLGSGSASESVKLKGKTGADLKLTSKTPVALEKKKKLERTVVKEGKGEVIKDGSTASVAMTMFNGANGDVLQQQPAGDVPVSKEGLAKWAYEGIRCGVPGQQAVVVAAYGEVFGAAKPTELPFEGITEKDPIVIVMDFAKSQAPDTLDPKKLPKKAEGTAKKAPKGFPEVKLAKDGAPTITIPEGAEAPKKLETATLIEGKGDTVKEGDRVYVNYRGVIWRTGEEFDSSWSRGEPIDFLAKEGPGGVIGGFAKALIGQKVGSQVISVVPAEDGGYGAAQLEQMGHQKDDVMVFVLDILGSVSADSK